MDIRPTLGGKNLLHDFSLSNRKRLTKNWLDEFSKEIVKRISLKNIGRMSILQKSSHNVAFENRLKNPRPYGIVLVWPDGPTATRQSRLLWHDWGAFGFLSVPGPDVSVWQPRPGREFGS
jgi:hypothetical protein